MSGWTSERVNAAVNMRESGMTLREIGEALGGLSPNTVNKKFHHMGYRGNRPENPWTPERIERLKQLRNEGRSASEIAMELGAGITRNAVIGKAMRLGLPTVAPVSLRGTSAKTDKQRRRYERERKVRIARPRAYHPPKSPFRPRPIEDLVEPVSLKVPLLDLRADSCRWPTGDPQQADFHFCGHGQFVETGRDGKPRTLPYCEYHARVAYQPPKDWERSNSYAVRLAGHETPHLVPA